MSQRILIVGVGGTNLLLITKWLWYLNTNKEEKSREINYADSVFINPSIRVSSIKYSLIHSDKALFKLSHIVTFISTPRIESPNLSRTPLTVFSQMRKYQNKNTMLLWTRRHSEIKRIPAPINKLTLSAFTKNWPNSNRECKSCKNTYIKNNSTISITSYLLSKMNPQTTVDIEHSCRYDLPKKILRKDSELNKAKLTLMASYPFAESSLTKKNNEQTQGMILVGDTIHNKFSGCVQKEIKRFLIWSVLGNMDKCIFADKPTYVRKQYCLRSGKQPHYKTLPTIDNSTNGINDFKKKVCIKMPGKTYVPKKQSRESDNRYFEESSEFIKICINAANYKISLEIRNPKESEKITIIGNMIRDIRCKMGENRECFSKRIGIDSVDLMIVENGVCSLAQTKRTVKKVDKAMNSKILKWTI
jgi:hypothetical protein